MISARTKADLQEIVAKYCLASDQKDVPAHMEFYAQEGYIDGGMRSRPRNGGRFSPNVCDGGNIKKTFGHEFYF